MRIVHLSADPGVPVFGCKGSSVHVQEVIRAFRALGHEVEIVSARAGGDPPADLRDVPVHHISSVDHDGTSVGRERARREAGRRSADVLDHVGPVDLLYERYSLWGSAGMTWARAAGVPGILEVNAPLPEEQATFRTLHDRAAADEVAATVITAARAVIAVSGPVREWAIGAVPDVERREVARRAHVVPNGVDTDRIRPVRDRIAPNADDILTIGFVGTLKAWHGLETLTDAMRILPDTRRWRLLVVGDGPERDALARRLEGVGIDVDLVGAVDPGRVPELLGEMDVAVAPYPRSASYYSPLKLMEYLAAGLPVVASDVASVTDVVDHDVTGVVVPPDDAVALADALTALASDPQRRAALAARARDAAVRRHTWAAAATRILDLALHPAPTP